MTDLAGTQRVLKFDPTGNARPDASAPTEGLIFPNGVAVDKDGRVYVTDSNNGRLLVFDASGALVAKIGRGAGRRQSRAAARHRRRWRRPGLRRRLQRPGRLRLSALGRRRPAARAPRLLRRPRRRRRPVRLPDGRCGGRTWTRLHRGHGERPRPGLELLTWPGSEGGWGSRRRPPAAPAQPTTATDRTKGGGDSETSGAHACMRRTLADPCRNSCPG